MISPQVNVPYALFGKHFNLIKEHSINPELYFTAIDLEALKPGDIESLKKSLDYGPAYTIHAPFMDLSPGALDPAVLDITKRRIMQAMDIAEVLGANAVVCHSGYEKWKFDHKVDVWLKQSIGTWTAVLERASDIGVVIAVENIFEDTPENLVLLMRELGGGNFGICFDIGHFNLFSSSPLADWLEKLEGNIKELHLHDNNKNLDEHLGIGEGTIDFKPLFAALKDKDIIHTVEAHSPAGVLKSMAWLKDSV